MGIRVTVIIGAPCAQSSYCCLLWFVNIGVKFMRKAISDLDEFPKPLKSKVRILIGLIHHKDATATSRVMIILQLFIGEPPPPLLSRSPLLWGKNVFSFGLHSVKVSWVAAMPEATHSLTVLGLLLYDVIPVRLFIEFE